ncbi:MAG: translation elongation factor Ts, partial [Clostridiaceae bacterium]|nr:translation elongation factor Ts [Clostridiaceae bacterium]
NQEFITFVQNVAAIVLKNNPGDIDALYAMPYDQSKTIRDALNELIAKIGENMNVRRFERFEGVVCDYVHGGGRIGVIVEFSLSDKEKANDAKFKEFAKDIAMQVAAANPQYTKKDSVPADVLAKEKEILRAQALNEGKPEAIVDKMVEGRISKFYKEVCLVEQEYIKDPDMSVAKYMQSVAKELGCDIDIIRFARFEKGEGIEKKEDNFADEVTKMIK